MNNQLTHQERQERLERLKNLIKPHNLSSELEEKTSLTIQRFIDKLDEVSFTLKTVEGLQGGQLEGSLTALIGVLSDDTPRRELRGTIGELVARLDTYAVQMHAQAATYDQAKSQNDHTLLTQLKDLTFALAALNDIPRKIGTLKAELINPEQISALLTKLEAVLTQSLASPPPDFPYTATFTRDSRNRISAVREQYPDYTTTTVFDRDDMGRITAVRTNETP